MTKNPYKNAFTALGYIFLVALVLNFGERFASDKPDTFFAPVAFISLFSLSAAIMGYLFLGTPILMFLNGEKKEGVSLFLKTVVSFAVITAVVLTLTFSGII